MFGKQITLFRLLGFEVKLDLSWLFLAVIITWGLAKGFFPSYYKGLSEIAYWWMGALGAVGLFASIVVHELCHSVVARRFGIKIRGITLFIFGGVAEMEDEPPTAKSELWMAAAGPLMSAALSGIFWALFRYTIKDGEPNMMNGVLYYLAFINIVLAGFNLIPAFPLDGGRILRAALWVWKKDFRWATKIASALGSAFGVLLIAMGVYNVIGGDFIGGVWYFLIGMMLRSAAKSAVSSITTRNALRGEKVIRFMKSDPVTVPGYISVKELVEKYVYTYHHKLFPVVEDDRLVGCVTTRQIKELPKEKWSNSTVRDMLISCDPAIAIGPDDDAVKAMSTMYKSGHSRLMVVEGDKLIGILALKDIMEFLSLKLDLEGAA
jgi:Zn-dependent protease/predicted transcriptional regulator